MTTPASLIDSSESTAFELTLDLHHARPDDADKLGSFAKNGIDYNDHNYAHFGEIPGHNHEQILRPTFEDKCYEALCEQWHLDCPSPQEIRAEIERLFAMEFRTQLVG